MSICVSEEKSPAPKFTTTVDIKAPLEERFSIIVEDQQLYTLFEQYLITQFSHENLHFYNEVNKFHTMTDADEIAEVANRLCKTYFGHGGSEPALNVSVSIQQKILKALEHPTVTMFDEAYADIEQILKTLYITFIGDGSSTPPEAKKSGFRFSCLDSEES